MTIVQPSASSETVAHLKAAGSTWLFARSQRRADVSWRIRGRVREDLGYVIATRVFPQLVYALTGKKPEPGS